MKKMVIVLGILCLIGGCSKKEKKVEVNDNLDNEDVVKEEDLDSNVIDSYIDDNNTLLGLYLYTNSYTPRRLLTVYETNFVVYKDIVSIEVFGTRDEEISGSVFQNVFKEYFNEEENKHKIGFEVSFETSDKSYRKTILRPNDVWEFFDYLQLYLYDDLHQDIGSWYSHVTEEEYNDKTLFTSIKLTCSTKCLDITSDIRIMVFSYDEDDFDSNGYYRGNSKYEAIVRKI